MLEGWYCRTMANQQSLDHQRDEDDEQERDVHRGIADSGSDEEESQVVTVSNLNPRIDYKGQYSSLKKKLKFLLYVSLLMHNKQFLFLLRFILGK